MASPTLEKALEKASGESIARLRSLSLADARRLAEEKFGAKFGIVSHWPFVGRGTIMRNNVLTHAQVEAAFDAAISKS